LLTGAPRGSRIRTHRLAQSNDYRSSFIFSPWLAFEITRRFLMAAWFHLPPLLTLALSATNASKTSTKSEGNKGDFGDGGSRFPVPLNILGGGDVRWPQTPVLDRDTREEICRSEIWNDAAGPAQHATAKDIALGWRPACKHGSARLY